jgi:hypothetical protein
MTLNPPFKSLDGNYVVITSSVDASGARHGLVLTYGESDSRVA